MEDIEIARSVKLNNITDIAKKINISDEFVELYGKYKAKVSNSIYEDIDKNEDGKLILVTSINPTPLGEGKTTVSIGLADALNHINKKTILALREPSLGPVFGIKGGATGGGFAQVAPMEDINLHFTGDIHAITSANNLLSAMIDNHIFFGNELKIKKIVWKRCVDLNDRILRKVEVGLSNEKNMSSRIDGFDITVASEVMAILCLSENIKDLKRRLGNIIIGYNEDDEPIFARDLKAEGAMAVLLKDAINPNLVQTLEHNPAFIHGGPFANIAHGCNSIRATRLAMKLGDYVVTEAGFGADLGAEKFIDIKCRKFNIKPSVVVCVATLKALKYHGGVGKSKVKLKNENALEKGMENLLRHIDNLRNKFNTNIVVAINKYADDLEEEIEFLKKQLENINVQVSLVEVWEKGGKGAVDLASRVVELAGNDKELKYIYNLEDNIKTKIEKLSKEIYGAQNVVYSNEAEEEIERIERYKNNYPVCIAKTQYSFSDSSKNLLCDGNYDIHINDVSLKNGAEFIVVKAGKIMTMPGLPKIPSAEIININDIGEIKGIF